MHPKTATAIFEWSAGVVIGLVPILCHSLVTLAGRAANEQPGAWAVDVLFVAITTSGLCAVSLFSRLARGAVALDHIKPHTMFLMAINMVAFLLSGVLFGQVSAGAARSISLIVPVTFLIVATASSLYFEILVSIEAARGEASDTAMIPAPGPTEKNAHCP